MRRFESAFPSDFLRDYQAGTLRYTYRGTRCLKSPIDMALYLKAIWDIKPATVIEIGTHSGGCALWLADVVQSFGLKAQVYSIDLKPPSMEMDPRITLLQGDVTDLASVFADSALDAAPHPWFVTEDSAHTHKACASALAFLSTRMETGDLLVMEDGVLDELGLSERYEGGPNRAIAEFLEKYPSSFTVAVDLCDLFGRNATYAPNGYLRKT